MGRGPAATCLLAVPSSAPEWLAGTRLSTSPSNVWEWREESRGGGGAGGPGRSPGLEGPRPRLQSPRALRHVATALCRATDEHRSRVSTATAPRGGGGECTAGRPGLQTRPRAGDCYSRAGGQGPSALGLALLAQLGLGPQDRAAGLEQGP